MKLTEHHKLPCALAVSLGSCCWKDWMFARVMDEGSCKSCGRAEENIASGVLRGCHSGGKIKVCASGGDARAEGSAGRADTSAKRSDEGGRC